jgi:hypothetical protein
VAKLIGHYFGREGYGTWELNGLKGTNNQYKKIVGETTENVRPKFANDYWNVLRKDELRRLRYSHYSFEPSYFMYSKQEDMPYFKALVVEALTNKAEYRREAYEKTLALLQKAREIELD